MQRFGRLDILVHNAGALGRLTPVAHILPNDWSEVVAVNLSAAWRLIRTCDPLLRLAPAGRAVFVTESRAREPLAYWGAMGATKAGMEHLVQTWAQEVASTRLRVNLFDPGPVATRMRSNAFPGEDRTPLPAPRSVGANAGGAVSCVGRAERGVGAGGLGDRHSNTLVTRIRYFAHAPDCVGLPDRRQLVTNKIIEACYRPSQILRPHDILQ